MKRSLFAALFIASLSSVGCHSNGPRALVLVDSAAHAEAVAAKAKAFEASAHREVQIIHVPRADEAVRIAARGDADVALVPEGTPMGDFANRHDGDARGVLDAGGEKLTVYEINAAAHPTVDAAGAHALAAFLAAK